MNHILITGMSGVGKSSVLSELRGRGHHCIEMDNPEWSFMDDDGNQHWKVDRLNAALGNSNKRPIFVAGCAEEQSQLRDQFAAIILLRAPLDIMKQRIQQRKDNCYGKDSGQMDLIEKNLICIEPLLRKSCTHEITTTLPLEIVVNQIESIAAEQGGQPDAFGAGYL